MYETPVRMYGMYRCTYTIRATKYEYVRVVSINYIIQYAPRTQVHLVRTK